MRCQRRFMKKKHCWILLQTVFGLVQLLQVKCYVLFDDVGRLSLKELAEMKSRYKLSGDDLVTNYTYTTSIDDSYNYVKLIKPNKKSGKGDAYVEQDSSKIKDWGKLQYYEKVDEDANEDRLKRKLEICCAIMLRQAAS